MSAQSFLTMLAVSVPAIVVSMASGQVQSVEPYAAVVVTDDTRMRCGFDSGYYPIATLIKGQVVRVDGQVAASATGGEVWLRIEYPAGTPALVGADVFQPDAGGKTGTLTKANALRAFNQSTGLKGSWSPALEASLSAGTKLNLMEPEAASDGRGNMLFKVVPPAGARGFVPGSALRRATPEEAAAAQNKAPAAQPAAPVTEIKQGTPAGPIATPAATPTTPPGMQLNTPAATPAVKTPEVAVEIKPAQPIPASPYEKLESAFESVRKQPMETAEYTELMAEIQAEIAKLDDTPNNRTIRGRLQQRWEYLKISQDIREQQRKLADVKTVITENDRLIQEKIAEMDRARLYTLVGRLSASTIYDGKRLPLMYRVQTVGGGAPRTLAYLKPDPKLGIDGKLGQLVGVVGDSTIDPTLKITMITPLRVDTLGASQGLPTEAKAPAADPATTTTNVPADKPADGPG